MAREAGVICVLDRAGNTFVLISTFKIASDADVEGCVFLRKSAGID